MCKYTCTHVYYLLCSHRQMMYDAVIVYIYIYMKMFVLNVLHVRFKIHYNILLRWMLLTGLNIAQSSGSVGGCYWISQRKTAKGPHSWEKVSQTRTWSLLFQYLNINVWTFSWLAHSAPSPVQTDMSMIMMNVMLDFW